jgi:hypothetical protein
MLLGLENVTYYTRAGPVPADLNLLSLQTGRPLVGPTGTARGPSHDCGSMRTPPASRPAQVR